MTKSNTPKKHTQQRKLKQMSNTDSIKKQWVYPGAPEG